MFIFLFVFLGGCFLFLFSSLHSLLFLLLVEFYVVGCLFLFVFSFFSWFTLLMFLLFSVCLGSYGISVYISVTRGKGSSWFISF